MKILDGTVNMPFASNKRHIFGSRRLIKDKDDDHLIFYNDILRGTENLPLQSTCIHLREVHSHDLQTHWRISFIKF